MVDDSPKPIPENVKIAIHHLLWVWHSYASNKPRPGDVFATDSSVVFWHDCMTAGEIATDWLVELGLGSDDGWAFRPNRAAIDIMNMDGSKVPYPSQD